MIPNVRGGGGGCGVSANEYSCAHKAQINYEDTTLYLTYALKFLWKSSHAKYKKLNVDYVYSAVYALSLFGLEYTGWQQ
jgi:hypothetical protein